MVSPFHNKRIWITGASSGIGAAMAEAFAAQHAHLILSSRSQDALEQTAKKCIKAGAASVMVRPLDLEKYAQLPAIAADILAQVGKIDILVNNGGISQRSVAMETGMDTVKKIMDVNFLGAVALTGAVLPAMLTHQLGHIVVISSITGKFGAPGRSAYAASKHALHGYFDSLRAELAHTPIKVTLICPGSIRTQISLNALRGDGSAFNQKDERLEKGMSPESMARKALQAIASEKNEALIGGKEILAVYIKRFFPGYFSRMISKTKL